MPPQVALESTVFVHGLPAPHHVETALRLEAIIREVGATPRTLGILKGEIIAGLSETQIQYLAHADGVSKVSLRDIPVAVARRRDGATTVASSLWIAHRQGIPVFATGGIGGVHRAVPTGSASFDISADLEALARFPVTVVCAGPKAILDLPATREVLETRGVTLVGYGTDELPAFYSRESGLPVDVRCDTPEEVAALVQAHRHLQLETALLVTVPVPQAHAIPQADLEPLLEQAHAEAEAQGLHAAALTPFLLSRLGTLSGERTLHTNIVLLENNARIAAQIALALESGRGDRGTRGRGDR